MKFFKNKLTVTVIVLSVTFLVLIGISASRNIKGLEGSAGNALSPIQKVAYGINRGVKDFVDFFLNFSSVRDENQDLKEENNELKDKLSEYSDLAQENEKLKALLDFQEQRSEYNYISTNIIGTRGSILEGYILDKGSKDGVKKDMVVVSAEGLVGKITSVAKNWCVVECIINENIAVSVMPESTREKTGILQGYTDSNTNENLTKINYLPMDSKIKKGDVILTSGLGAVYPKEIRVGEVVSVEEDKVQFMKTAIVKPYVDFDTLEDLMIIVPKDTREIEYN
ncbi:rod shape-determining protein MreC [Clostridium sp. MSJ-8]|uniref:rod shape-determining protein MreC n=1 Tax=Clostridium sp. MSJ-8 TaxID=2841510 RepID=UPI001C0ED61B|nr:rod shape-determining protein MreC [Clostridium sp. MSJ-8]MBU5488931.1 rod shape-determining protein MreC [Clostridium sp. MSJ-8]